MKQSIQDLISDKNKFHKILLYGWPDSGKSFGIVKIIDSLSDSKDPKNRVLVLDTNKGLKEAFEQYCSPKMYDRIDYFSCDTWSDVTNALTNLDFKKHKWLFVEQGSDLWALAQAYYIEKKKNKELSETEIKDSMIPIAGWVDVKFYHNTLFMNRLKGLPINVILTAEAKELDTKGVHSKEGKPIKSPDRSDLVQFYQNAGRTCKAEGEGGNIFRFDVVLYLYRRFTKYYMSCVRMRGRTPFKDTELTEEGFYMSYLMECI